MAQREAFNRVVEEENINLDYAVIFNPASELFDVLYQLDLIKNALAQIRVAQQAALYKVGRPAPREFVKATQRELTQDEKKKINSAIGQFYDHEDTFETLQGTRAIFMRAIETIDFLLQEKLEQVEKADMLARQQVKATYQEKITVLTEFYNNTTLLLRTLRQDFTRGPLPVEVK